MDNRIIGEALYNPAKIFKGNKEGYYVFAQIVKLSLRPKNLYMGQSCLM
jgi:hypothetical protein